jgi:molecular chaperone GrpE
MMKKDPQLQRITELEEQLELLQTDLELANSSKLRALADLENFQRRESENKKNWSNFAVAEILKAFFPNLLELELGAEHSENKDFKVGVDKFFENLTKQGGLRIVPKKGDSIDPNFHDVIMAAEGEPGKIAQVFESGWQLGEMVITPAKVSAS